MRFEPPDKQAFCIHFDLPYKGLNSTENDTHENVSYHLPATPCQDIVVPNICTGFSELERKKK